jgi:hypothetical protein
MSRVQSILTYTIPAKTGETTPPAAPIRCGCDDLLLILEDRSLLQTALKGILRTEIKSVAVSNQPVPFVDPVSGRNIPVWKYDYTVEYNDTDLTDASYRVRKCDVIYNCCYACSQAYTDRQLEGYVQSVLGDNVNNADAQNPVITEQPIAVTDSLSIDLTSSGSFGHTIRADARISATADNVLSIQADGLYVPDTEFTSSNTCALGGVGLAYAIRGLTDLGNNNFLINGAPEHSTGSNSGVQLVGPTVTNVGVTQLLNQNILINNPSTCRDFRYFLQQSVSVELDMQPLAHVFLNTSAKGYRYGPFNAPWRGTPDLTTFAYGVLAPGASTIGTLFLNIDVQVGSAGVFVWGASQTIGYIGGTV